MSLCKILVILLLENGCLCLTIRHDPVATTRTIRPREHETTVQSGSRPALPSPLLQARVAFPPTFLGDDWTLDHHDFTCLLPLASAAAELLGFYEDLAAFAATTDNAPAETYRMWVGEIMLEVMAPSGYKITWLDVQHFANEMIGLTKRGYVNTYQVNFIHRTTGMLVTFSLYVGYMRAVTDFSS